jgi:hypothetical protein
VQYLLTHPWELSLSSLPQDEVSDSYFSPKWPAHPKFQIPSINACTEVAHLISVDQERNGGAIQDEPTRDNLGFYSLGTWVLIFSPWFL